MLTLSNHGPWWGQPWPEGTRSETEEAQLVAPAAAVRGMPARPVDGRVPACQHLGCRRRVFASNANGWREILPRQETGPAAASTDLPRPNTASTGPEDPRRASWQVLQLPLLLAPSSDLTIASVFACAATATATLPGTASKVGVSFDHDDCAATSAAALCFSKSNPLLLELWASTGTPMWFDPMLEEFATSLVVCRAARVQVPGCPPTTAVAS
jgi:hypothetical protein